MRTAVCIALIGSTLGPLSAQVQLDTLVRFTGAEGSRRIDGLAPPTEDGSVITVEASLRASYQWATASNVGNSIQLTTTVPVASYENGLLLRFLSPATFQGPVSVSLPALPSVALVRTDGEPPSAGQLIAGRVAEILYAGGTFTLLNAPERNCPPGYLRVNDNYCIEAASSAPVDFFTAAEQCADRGGRLCSWDEHHAACVLLAGQFSNLFADWEYIDDTSNHTHTANQVARTTCTSQRTLLPTVVARVRCCHHPR